jgi:predicted lipid-binding transport protein (Tim44 family)
MVVDQGTSTKQIVESAWQRQAVWSQTAGRMKSGLTGWRTGAAIAGVVGAILETLAATLPDALEFRAIRTAIAFVGAVVLAIVPYVSKTKLSRERVRDWVRARSVSEALKEEIYRFLVGAPPYGAHVPPSTLVERVEQETDKVKDLNIYAANVAPHPSERPTELTVDGYVAERVNGQINDYYLPKARQNAQAAKRLHDLEFGLGLLAVILGALASATTAAGFTGISALGSWVAVLTTAGAAVTAHLAANRYDLQAITFYATANRLAGLRDSWQADPARMEPSRVAQFVNDSETAISSENEAWLAAWSRDQEQREG